MEANEVVALVYRVGKPGCRQYAFRTADELEQWAARPAYRKAILRVLVFDEAQVVAQHVVPAAEAAAVLRRALQ